MLLAGGGECSLWDPEVFVSPSWAILEPRCGTKGRDSITKRHLEACGEKRAASNKCTQSLPCPSHLLPGVGDSQ